VPLTLPSFCAFHFWSHAEMRAGCQVRERLSHDNFLLARPKGPWADRLSGLRGTRPVTPSCVCPPRARRQVLRQPVVQDFVASA
jgi:hypothetical protein